MTEPLIGAIDCGTSSVRFMVYVAESGQLIAHHQIPTKTIYPKQEWVEQDALEIMAIVNQAIEKTIDQLIDLNIDPSTIKGIGISNQRETTIAWDKETGQPYHNAIIWLDGRTREIVDNLLDEIPGRDFNFYKRTTGLPISTYFTAFKAKWLLSNVPQVEDALKNKKLMIGTVDTWLLWNLCGTYATDVTNASRTFLMNIETLEWDRHLCHKVFGIPIASLPKIQPSSSHFGIIQAGPLKGLPITGVIGDQSAALVGHQCLSPGQIKSTYGTGCFMVQNLGPGSVNSVLKSVSKEARASLILTIAYKLGEQPTVYALEGSIAVVGASMSWLRDNIELINNFDEVEDLANQVDGSGGVFFVPAFQGLFAPYWDPNASGLFIGLSQYTRKAHIVRAMLESVAFQTTDILSLMRPSNSGLMVDGGMTTNDRLCQIIADLNNIKVIRPAATEATALGCAMIAGYTLGLWDLKTEHLHRNQNKINHNLNHTPSATQNSDQITTHISNGIANHSSSSNHAEEDLWHGSISFVKNRVRSLSLSLHSLDDSIVHPDSTIFKPSIDHEVRDEMLKAWRRAVERSMSWTKIKKLEMKKTDYMRKASLPISLYIISSLAMLIFGKFVSETT